MKTLFKIRLLLLTFKNFQGDMARVDPPPPLSISLVDPFEIFSVHMMKKKKEVYSIIIEFNKVLIMQFIPKLFKINLFIKTKFPI